MKSKKISILIILFGLILVGTAVGIIFSGIDNNGITGILSGVGAGVLVIGMANFLESCIYKKKPEWYKKVIIEQSDERNVAINNKAKAKAGTMLMYLNFILTMVMSVLHIEQWATFSLLLVTLLYQFCTMILFVKYKKD